MDNCLNEPLGQHKTYYAEWNKARVGQTLSIEVIAGALKGTTGEFVGMDFPYYVAGRTRRAWAAFHETPSSKNWLVFREAILAEDKMPRISIQTSQSPFEITKVSMTNCAWSFSLLPMNKVSKPRVKNKVEEQPIPDVYDHLGEKINIGDFCSYILYHHRYNGAQIYYGTVTKITPKGDVYCTDVNVGDWPDGHNTPKEKKVLDPSMITILNESIMDRIILARLGA